jgi:iron complex transport system substrate-binding protein
MITAERFEVKNVSWLPPLLLVCLVVVSDCFAGEITVRDLAGRMVTIEKTPERIVCVAPGSLRLIAYLQALDRVVGVEEIEKRFPKARPYWMANPQLAKLPIIGPGGVSSINRRPDLESILSVSPDLIFISYMQPDKADELSRQLSIPVVVLSYGDFGSFDERLYVSLEVAGKILRKDDRARAVVDYIRTSARDLASRVSGIPEADKPRTYIGGIGWKGGHGLESTDAGYQPFAWVKANNVAAVPGKQSHYFIDREKLLALNPEVIFLDGGGSVIIREDYTKHPRFYDQLDAFKRGNVFSLYPFNWYMTNIGTVIADAYAVGKILYPQRFEDVAIPEQSDAIYDFLLGKPLYGALRSANGVLGRRIHF